MRMSYRDWAPGDFVMMRPDKIDSHIFSVIEIKGKDMRIENKSLSVSNQAIGMVVAVLPDRSDDIPCLYTVFPVACGWIWADHKVHVKP